MKKTDLEKLVDRFLAWKLPADFAPDAGISFKRPDYPASYPGPSGTNLLDAGQAEAMLRHVLGDALDGDGNFAPPRPENSPRRSPP